MGLVDDLVCCCSDIYYLTERPRNLPLPLGSEGKLFDMFCFAFTGYPLGDGIRIIHESSIYDIHDISFSSLRQTTYTLRG